MGDGKSVHIYKDNWVPREGNGRIVSAPNLLHSDAMVSQLIDQDIKCWNSSLIDQIFYPFEAEKLNQSQSAPSLNWTFCFGRVPIMVIMQ